MTISWAYFGRALLLVKSIIICVFSENHIWILNQIVIRIFFVEYNRLIVNNRVHEFINKVRKRIQLVWQLSCQNTKKQSFISHRLFSSTHCTLYHIIWSFLEWNVEGEIILWDNFWTERAIKKISIMMESSLNFQQGNSLF